MCLRLGLESKVGMSYVVKINVSGEKRALLSFSSVLDNEST